MRHKTRIGIAKRSEEARDKQPTTAGASSGPEQRARTAGVIGKTKRD